MLITRRQILGALIPSAAAAGARLYVQTPGGAKPQGAYLVTSGGDRIDEHFRRLLDGHARRLVFVPTAASSLRSKYGTIWNPDLEENRDAFIRELQLRFNALEVEILHTRSRQVADSEEFVRPLRAAGAVWMSGGNAGRLADAYLDTRVVGELRAIVERGGIVAGESAGAIIQGSYVVRGNPDKPVLMVNGRERGFGFLPDVAINPHLSASQRENELVSVIDRYPHLLGLGIDDDTALLVRGDVAEVIGSGRVAVYDDRKHSSGWYFWLKAGDKLDLRSRKVLPPSDARFVALRTGEPRAVVSCAAAAHT